MLQGVPQCHSVVLCVALFCVTVCGEQEIRRKFAESLIWQEFCMCDMARQYAQARRQCKLGTGSARGKNEQQIPQETTSVRVALFYFNDIKDSPPFFDLGASPQVNPDSHGGVR